MGRYLSTNVSRCRQGRVCNVREAGMSHLSEFSLSRRFVRQSSDNLQAVQSTHLRRTYIHLEHKIDAIPDFWSVCVSCPFINAMYKNDAPVSLIGVFICPYKGINHDFFHFILCIKKASMN